MPVAVVVDDRADADRARAASCEDADDVSFARIEFVGRVFVQEHGTLLELGERDRAAIGQRDVAEAVEPARVAGEQRYSWLGLARPRRDDCHLLHDGRRDAVDHP